MLVLVLAVPSLAQEPTEQESAAWELPGWSEESEHSAERSVRLASRLPGVPAEGLAGQPSEFLP